MQTVTETERLYIRRFTNTDADAAFVLTLLNTEGWLAFIGDRGIRTLNDAKTYIEERFTSKYGSTEFIMYAMDLKEGGETIGMCGLVKRDFLDHPDVGYALLPAYEGKGYASEAAAAMLKYATEDLGYHTMYAIVTPENERSVNVLKKLGFTYAETQTNNGVVSAVFKRESIDPSL